MRTTRLLSLAATGALMILPATASAAVTHTVRRGESLTSIAATDGLSISALAAANGLSPDAELTVGRALVIPPQGAVEAPAASPVATPSTAVPEPAVAGSGGYVVPVGATLSAIAARFGTSVDALAAANGISPDGILFAGRTLQIPGAHTVATAAAGPAASSGPAPSAEWVTPDEVGQIAADDGVAPSLAEAIADEESGFDDDEVSGTGAVGVMQIEPATWRDLTASGELGGDDAALQNVHGGVALLRDLLADTGGDEVETIAAYYQGLQSVRSHGMFADTRAYVRTVLALQQRY